MIEQVQTKWNSRRLQPFAELGHDAGRVKPTFDASARAQSKLLEQVNILQADHISRSAGDFTDVGHAAGAVTHARNLNNQVDR